MTMMDDGSNDMCSSSTPAVPEPSRSGVMRMAVHAMAVTSMVVMAAHVGYLQGQSDANVGAIQEIVGYQRQLRATTKHHGGMGMRFLESVTVAADGGGGGSGEGSGYAYAGESGYATSTSTGYGSGYGVGYAQGQTDGSEDAAAAGYGSAYAGGSQTILVSNYAVGAADFYAANEGRGFGVGGFTSANDESTSTVDETNDSAKHSSKDDGDDDSVDAVAQEEDDDAFASAAGSGYNVGYAVGTGYGAAGYGGGTAEVVTDSVSQGQSLGFGDVIVDPTKAVTAYGGGQGFAEGGGNGYAIGGSDTSEFDFAGVGETESDGGGVSVLNAPTAAPN